MKRHCTTDDPNLNGWAPERCGAVFDDTERSTICPHPELHSMNVDPIHLLLMCCQGAIVAHGVLGCEWGWSIALPDDEELCWEQAVRGIVLHDPHDVVDPDIDNTEFRFCEAHALMVEAQTDPHTFA